MVEGAKAYGFEFMETSRSQIDTARNLTMAAAAVLLGVALAVLLARFQADEPCTVTFSDLEQAARVVNLSTGGATLALTAGLNGESGGILRLDRHAVRIPFTVRSAEGDAIRIEFDEADPALPALHAVVERLTAALQPLDAAS